jgi:hypothetical protein
MSIDEAVAADLKYFCEHPEETEVPPRVCAGEF